MHPGYLTVNGERREFPSLHLPVGSDRRDLVEGWQAVNGERRQWFGGVGILYGATIAEADRMQLYSIDVATGVPTAIGGLQTVDSGAFAGIGLASLDGVMYAATVADGFNPDRMQFYRIDVATGVPTAVGGVQTVDATTNAGFGLASLNGVMYGAVSPQAARMQFYSINVATGAPTAIGGLQTVDNVVGTGIGLASLNGVMYAATVADAFADRMQFYSINVATGAPTAIGGRQTVDILRSSGIGLESRGGVMYAATVGALDRMQLYSIDVATGAPTAIGALQTVDVTNSAGIGLGVV